MANSKTQQIQSVQKSPDFSLSLKNRKIPKRKREKYQKSAKTLQHDIKRN